MEIRVLGPVEIWHDMQRLAAGAAQRRGVLALLAARAGEAPPHHVRAMCGPARICG